MSGPALESLEQHVLATRPDGDAIVPGPNNTIRHVNVGGVAKVHSVGVGALVGSGDLQFAHLQVDAVDQFGMESHCIHEV